MADIPKRRDAVSQPIAGTKYVNEIGDILAHLALPLLGGERKLPRSTSTVRLLPVTKDGGIAGDGTTTCTYTYTFTLDGTTYTNMAMTGRGKRNDVGAMTEGHFGEIQIEADGPKLYWVDESLNFSGCSTSDIIGGF